MQENDREQRAEKEGRCRTESEATGRMGEETGETVVSARPKRGQQKQHVQEEQESGWSIIIVTSFPLYPSECSRKC